MSNDTLWFAFSVLNAVFTLAAAILAFIGAALGKNENKTFLGCVYSAGFIFWMFIIFPPSPQFIIGLGFAIWLVFVFGVIKGLADVRS